VVLVGERGAPRYAGGQSGAVISSNIQQISWEKPPRWQKSKSTRRGKVSGRSRTGIKSRCRSGDSGSRRRCYGLALCGSNRPTNGRGAVDTPWFIHRECERCSKRASPLTFSANSMGCAWRQDWFKPTLWRSHAPRKPRGCSMSASEASAPIQRDSKSKGRPFLKGRKVVGYIKPKTN